MLAHLAIRDLVIVRELALDFSPGMTALTGETGAGKSILIDALGLTLGDKALPALIRAGCERAEVSSEFDLSDCPAASDWLRDHDLDENGTCQLRRVLVRNGRSRAYINGRPVPLVLLRELGERLLDIHGQHAHQSLLRPATQRELLDRYGGLEITAGEVAEHFTALQAARKKYEHLRQVAEDRHNRLDYLRFQITEIEPLVEAASHFSELEAEHHRLAHAERLRHETGEITAELADSEDDISSQLGAMQRQLDGLIALDKHLRPVAELLDSALVQIGEAAQTLRHYHDAMENDPAHLQALDEQIGRLHELERKHRVEVAGLPELLTRFCEERDTLDAADERLARLTTRVTELETTYRQAAKALSAVRHKTAARLSDVVTESMQTLNMQGGHFEVLCEARHEPTRHGSDHILFRVAANPGQPPAPLADAASGGELSRISLAIQVATADCGDTPTLIFDEVDVGIGGAVAEIIGSLLHELGCRRQVLCVTHLPQIAAKAHHHLRVIKHTSREATETDIRPLDHEHRIEEIARMLGGIEITAQTLAHAREILLQNN